MRLAPFIRANTTQIVSDWERFARTLTPASEGMSPRALRDHIRDILSFICDDIESSQTRSEQIVKSHGDKSEEPGYSVAEVHASLRHAGGFNMDQMVSEYRALRASIERLWRDQINEITREHLSDLTRLNEAIDQVLTESISHYTKKIDHSRHVFLGILSHDLRNPLGAILMSAQLVPKIGALNERQAMLVMQIEDSTARATEIVSQLLDLTRTRLGSGIPILKSVMNMGHVARLIVDEVRAIHPTRRFKLALNGNLAGEWDVSRMGQVFSNLLSNAVQYGSPESAIDVRVKGLGEQVELSVHNDGEPIAPEALSTVFDALVRAEEEKDEANKTGTYNLGLGLYITKEIVTAHGGTIAVTSSEKEGTCFTILLPQIHPEEEGDVLCPNQP